MIVANSSPCHLQQLPQIDVILHRKLFAWVLRSRHISSSLSSKLKKKKKLPRNAGSGRKTTIYASKYIYLTEMWELHVHCLWDLSLGHAVPKSHARREGDGMGQTHAREQLSSLLYKQYCSSPGNTSRHVNAALKSQCLQCHSNISLVSKERGHMGKIITT